MHELKQLNRELDVPQTSRPQLELHLDLIRRDVRGDALTHRLHRFDEVLARGARPHHRGDPLDVELAQFTVPGHCACLQEGLELPTLGPAFVVREVGVERSHQGAVLALRSEVGIHFPERGLQRELLDRAHRLHGESRCDLHRSVIREITVSARDEDHVDVAEIVEFACSRFSHSDDRESRGRHLLRRESTDPPRQGQGRIQRGGRQVGQCGRHPVDDRLAVRLLQIPRGDAGQLPAVGDA